MHLMDVQRIQAPISMTILQDITVVNWKLLRLYAARWKAIRALGNYMDLVVVVDQVIVTTLKSRGRWLDVIAKVQECDCVNLKQSSISAAILVAGMITYLSGPVSQKVYHSIFYFICSIL